MQAFTDEYRQDSDEIGQFINECCLTGDDRLRVRAGELYKAYKAWYDEAGLAPDSWPRFGKSMTTRGFKKGGSTYVIYEGIGLLDKDTQTV